MSRTGVVLFRINPEFRIWSFPTKSGDHCVKIFRIVTEFRISKLASTGRFLSSCKSEEKIRGRGWGHKGLINIPLYISLLVHIHRSLLSRIVLILESTVFPFLMIFADFIEQKIPLANSIPVIQSKTALRKRFINDGKMAAS